jgi:hypothetical protein
MIFFPVITLIMLALCASVVKAWRVIINKN